MKNILITCLCLFIIYNTAYSQFARSVYVKGSYNFFNMSDLKNLQQEFYDDLIQQGIGAKITDSYPAHYGLQAGLLIPLALSSAKEIRLGGFVDFTSTGGRVHYSDYSGEIKIDQKATAVSIGATISFSAYTKDIFQLYLDLNTRIIFSKLKNEISSRLFEQTETQTLDFSSVSFGFEPAIVPSINVYPFNFGISVSYMLALPTTLQFSAYDGANLLNKNGDEVTINWSGFKLGLIAKYLF